jgi:cbb3-type cytochrome oxidase subunit 3
MNETGQIYWLYLASTRENFDAAANRLDAAFQAFF